MSIQLRVYPYFIGLSKKDTWVDTDIDTDIDTFLQKALVFYTIEIIYFIKNKRKQKNSI